MASFTAAERRRIAAELGRGAGDAEGGSDAADAAAAPPPECPACGSALVVSKVARPAEVSYVRRRVLVTCAGCRRQAAVDVSEGGRP